MRREVAFDLPKVKDSFLNQNGSLRLGGGITRLDNHKLNARL